MDYEKGKKIENVEYALRQIIPEAWDDRSKAKTAEEMEKIYDKIDNAISDLREVLGRDY